jgi:cell division protein FtsX
MTLTKTQAWVTIAAASTVLLAFVFAGFLWAAETHFETVAAHVVSVDEVIAGFDKAISDSDKREIQRLIRKLEYLKQKGIITDQELYELEGLKQELEGMS